MILHPRKSADEIDRRLRALSDPDLERLLRKSNPDLLGSDEESYGSPDAPYWKRRIGFIALAGLAALSAGYSASVTHPVPAAHRYTHIVASRPQHRHPKVAAVRRAAAVHLAPAVHHAVPAYAPPAPEPDEALIRQARAQLLHERAIAANARAEAARAHRQAMLALQAQADARAWAQAEALAQARAEARAQALAQEQAESAQRDREEEQARENASDPNIKPGEGGAPTDTGRISTYPSAGAPVPVLGPVDTNCTPHRGSLFVNVLDHVRVGGTSVGGLLRLVHP